MDQSYSFLNTPITPNQGFWVGAKEIQLSPLVQNVQENLFAGTPDLGNNDLFILPDDIKLDDGILDIFNSPPGNFNEDYQFLDLSGDQLELNDSAASSPNHEPNLYFDNKSTLSTIDDLMLNEPLSPTISFQDRQNHQNVTIKTKTVKTSNYRPKSIVKHSSPYKITVNAAKLEEPSPVKITINEFDLEHKLMENRFEVEQPRMMETRFEVDQPRMMETRFEVDQPKMMESRFEMEQPKLIDSINNDVLLSKMFKSSGNDGFLGKLLDSDSDSDISIGYSPNSSPAHCPSSPEHCPSSPEDSIQDLPSKLEPQTIGPIRKKRSKAARNSKDFYPTPKEKLEKKKEQNKTAAQRYRQKKKKEEVDLASKVEELEKERKQLRKQYKQMKLEVRSCRKFLRAAFIAKGYCLTTGLQTKTER